MAFLLFLQPSFGYELILPSEKKNVTTSNYAFFVGKAKQHETLSINGTKIYIAPNGAFAHSVKLKDGENRIIVRTTYGMQMYKFYKSTPVQTNIQTEEMELTKGYVNCDNTPLRNTPIDAGLNRVAHLFGGTHIIVNGSRGSFYRVLLCKNKEAWIAKKDVTLTDEAFCPAEFINMDGERYKNAVAQTISFSKKLPYTLEDNDKEIIFRVYNPELSDESVYNINIPKPKKYAYTVSLNEGTYTIKVRNLPDNIKDATVVIDAGHGGFEKGAIGCLGDEEKNINLKIAQKVRQFLEAKGINVIMTRECDADIDLMSRVAIAKENDADIFVSIHLNSIGDIPMDIHKNRGTSVYYFNNNAKVFAKCMKKSVTTIAGTHDDGVRTGSFAVIRPTEYVGILVETAYMTNPTDSVLYRDEKWIDKAAQGIANGIEDFLTK